MASECAGMHACTPVTCTVSTPMPSREAPESSKDSGRHEVLTHSHGVNNSSAFSRKIGREGRLSIFMRVAKRGEKRQLPRGASFAFRRQEEKRRRRGSTWSLRARGLVE